MNHLLSLSIVCASLFLSACAFNNSEEPAPKETTTAQDVIETISDQQNRQLVDGTLTKENVKIWFEEEEIGSYTMRVTWPSSVKKVRIQTEGKTEIIHAPESQFAMSVGDSREISLQVTSFDWLGSEVSTLSLNAKSPIDYVLQGSTNFLTSDYTNSQINRFYIRSGAQLITYGHNFIITANKIVVEPNQDNHKAFTGQAHILTNNKGTFAKNTSELTGSTIVINAGEATGTLKIALIGVHGTDGKSGETIALENAVDLNFIDGALNGSSGQSGITRDVPEKCTGRNLDIPCTGGYTKCVKPSTPGTDGKAGKKGFDGEPGMNGGNSGNLQLFVKDGKNFKLLLGVKVGLPGKGGSGSKGFPGGLGGSGGAADGPCSAAANGQNGPSGSTGDNGADGQAGQEGLRILNGFESESVSL